MSVLEPSAASKPTTGRMSVPIGNRVLDSLSAVNFGIFLLCTLVVLSMVGMLIVQQNVNGFDAYYASLMPAEKAVYGWLGFFDIYYSWYFKLLLLILSLNIILASIDRFPSAWSYIVKPKLTATRKWLEAKNLTSTITLRESSVETAAKEISAAMTAAGLRTTITTSAEASFVFGESGKWNRIGAYIVHVALLTLFLGHFVALQTGFDADVRMVPGQRTDQIQLIQFDLDKKERFNVQLPFAMTCTDIQQQLIDPNGSIDVSNTMDWRTELLIDDPTYGSFTSSASLNSPVTYRGYRFFQAQTIPIGNARTVEITLTPESGGEPTVVKIDRNGSTNLNDGTRIELSDFQPDFTFGPNGQPDTRSGEYNNPAAVLNVTPPSGEVTRIFAFAKKLGDNMPVGAPKLGYRWRMTNFERSPFAHVLSIKYDPFNAAFIAWYVGGFGLVGALGFVFFFSHRRVWARIERGENGEITAVVAGEANRNPLSFADKYNTVISNISEKS